MSASHTLQTAARRIRDNSPGTATFHRAVADLLERIALDRRSARDPIARAALVVALVYDMPGLPIDSTRWPTAHIGESA